MLGRGPQHQRKPVAVRFSACTHPEWCWGVPSLLYSCYWVSFSAVEWLGHGIGHPPLPSKSRAVLLLPL